MRRLAIGLVAFGMGIFSGCSLEKPDSPAGRLIIRLEEATAQSPLEALSSVMPGYGVLADPSAISDINCFTVNVTGSGISSSSKLNTEGCSSPNNFNGTGAGVLAQPATRGNSMTVEIPSGLQRTVNVYGLYPSLPECGGASGNSTAGYFLGGTRVDTLDNTAVTIPISLTTSAIASKFTCTGHATTGFNTYVYAYGNNQIVAMKLDATAGTLTDVGTVSAPSITKMSSVPGTTYLYSVDNSSSVSAWALTNATGALSPASSINVGTVVNRLLVAPQGALWAFDTTSGDAHGLTFNASSFSGFTAGTTSGTSTVTPQYLATHPSLNVAYIHASGTLYKYDYNSSTTALSNMSSMGLSGAARLRPDGAFMYAIDASTSYIYTVNSSTGVTGGGTAIFPGTSGVNAASFDPASRYFYVVDNTSSLFRFTVDASTGGLTSMGSAYGLGAPTADMKVDPDGQFAVLVHTNGTIVPYRIGATGDLTTGASHTVPGFTSGLGLVIQKVPR